MNRASTVGPEQRVLLVEDEPGLQEALALVLEAEGYQVSRAHDGREGLARLAETPTPDIVVTDYMMPYMNGIEMIKQIRANPDYAGIPILLMSAAFPRSVDTELADAFLPKPTGVDQLLDVMARLLSPS